MKVLKRILWAITLLPLIGTAIVLPFMPATVPMHYDAAGNIDRWGSKYENLIFPVVIVLIILSLALIMRSFEKKAQTAAAEKDRAEAGTNARVVGITGLCMSLFFAGMQGSILYGAWQAALSDAERQTVDFNKISVILMGILLIVLANFMPKTRNNRLVGMRMSWSMYNDVTWRKSNRFGAFALMAAGALTILAGVFMKNSLYALLSMLAAVLLAAAGTVIYARKVYIRELADEKGER